MSVLVCGAQCEAHSMSCSTYLALYTENTLPYYAFSEFNSIAHVQQHSITQTGKIGTTSWVGSPHSSIQ